MSPSVDDVVEISDCFWFSFALLAGLALFIDKFLIRFIYQSIKNLTFLFYVNKSNTTSFWTTQCLSYLLYPPTKYTEPTSSFSLYSTHNIPTGYIYRSNLTI